MGLRMRGVSGANFENPFSKIKVAELTGECCEDEQRRSCAPAPLQDHAHPSPTGPANSNLNFAPEIVKMRRHNAKCDRERER